jgi:hypothetical protein
VNSSFLTRRSMLALFGLVFASSVGCTENVRTKSFGATQTIRVPCGQRVFNMTWKELNFWYATRPLAPDEEPQTSTFTEKSDLGLVQGRIVLVESRCER